MCVCMCVAISVVESKGGFGIPENMEKMQIILVVTVGEGTLPTWTQQE